MGNARLSLHSASSGSTQNFIADDFMNRDVKRRDDWRDDLPSSLAVGGTEDALVMLRKYDTSIIVDDSGSMVVVEVGCH